MKYTFAPENPVRTQLVDAIQAHQNNPSKSAQQVASAIASAIRAISGNGHYLTINIVFDQVRDVRYQGTYLGGGTLDRIVTPHGLPGLTVQDTLTITLDLAVAPDLMHTLLLDF